MIYIAVKIYIFLSLNNKNNKSLKKSNVFLNKSKISFENTSAKIYVCKIFKALFYIMCLLSLNKVYSYINKSLVVIINLAKYRSGVNIKFN